MQNLLYFLRNNAIVLKGLPGDVLKFLTILGPRLFLQKISITLEPS